MKSRRQPDPPIAARLGMPSHSLRKSCKSQRCAAVLRKDGLRHSIRKQCCRRSRVLDFAASSSSPRLRWCAGDKTGGVLEQTRSSTLRFRESQEAGSIRLQRSLRNHENRQGADRPACFLPRPDNGHVFLLRSFAPLVVRAMSVMAVKYRDRVWRAIVANFALIAGNPQWRSTTCHGSLAVHFISDKTKRAESA